MKYSRAKNQQSIHPRNIHFHQRIVFPGLHERYSRIMMTQRLQLYTHAFHRESTKVRDTNFDARGREHIIQ